MAEYPEKITIQIEDIDIVIRAINSLKKDVDELMAFKNAFIKEQEENKNKEKEK